MYTKYSPASDIAWRCFDGSAVGPLEIHQAFRTAVDLYGEEIHAQKLEQHAPLLQGMRRHA